MAELTAEDLRLPKGDIDPAVWFAGKDVADVDTLLAAYLTDAYERIPDEVNGEAARNAAARAYAMGRAARNVFMRLAAGPASFKLDNEGSETIIAEQIKAFRQMAEKYEAEFETAIDVGDTVGTLEPVDNGPAANRYVW